jgi:hypothetical protein
MSRNVNIGKYFSFGFQINYKKSTTESHKRNFVDGLNFKILKNLKIFKRSSALFNQTEKSVFAISAEKILQNMKRRILKIQSIKRNKSSLRRLNSE